MDNYVPRFAILLVALTRPQLPAGVAPRMIRAVSDRLSMFMQLGWDWPAAG